MKKRTVTLIEVDYNDLDDAITEFLREKGIQWKHGDERYEVVAYEEWGNDESHTFHVDGHSYTLEYKERIMRGELHYMTGAILAWMAEEGKIEKGTYKVDISW